MNSHRRFAAVLLSSIVMLSFFTFSVTSVYGKIAPKKTKAQVKTSAKKKTFTLIISKDVKGCLGKKGTIVLKKEINLTGKKDALSYLKLYAQVVDNGGFINYIDGYKSMYPIPYSKMTEDEKAKGVLGVDWFVYLNGNKTSVGANQIYPKASDVVMFDFHRWNRDEFKAARN